MSRAASRISVADVIDAIDGPVMVTACTSADDGCEQYDTCNIRDPLWRIKDQIVHALNSYSLQALAAEEPPLVPISVPSRPGYKLDAAGKARGASGADSTHSNILEKPRP